jgi:CRP/FNR family transcriptional regulator
MMKSKTVGHGSMHVAGSDERAPWALDYLSAMAAFTVTSDLWSDPALEASAQEALEILRAYLHVRHFKKGNFLWREGDTTGMLVVLKAGRVKVYRVLPEGREVTLFIFGPGDVFGFLPFLDGQAYPAHARALEDVQAEVMARATLLQVFESEPELAVTLIGLLGNRLRACFDLIRSLSMPGARARVAQALLALGPLDGATTDRPLISLPVSAQEFAGAIGIVPETFSRAMTSLVQKGILERVGSGRYQVLDLEELQRATDPDVE